MSKLRLFDERQPGFDDYLSTNASLQLRQTKLDGGGTVSATNFISQISMIGDNFNEDILTNLYGKARALILQHMSPDQWAVDLVTGMPWYESDVDMFFRPWSPTIAPDGFLKASEMGKIPLIAIALGSLAKMLPSLSKSLVGGTSAALAYRTKVNQKKYYRRIEDKVDELLDVRVVSPSAKQAEAKRNINKLDRMLTLTSAGIATNHHTYRTQLLEELKSTGSI